VVVVGIAVSVALVGCGDNSGASGAADTIGTTSPTVPVVQGTPILPLRVSGLLSVKLPEDAAIDLQKRVSVGMVEVRDAVEHMAKVMVVTLPRVQKTLSQVTTAAGFSQETTDLCEAASEVVKEGKDIVVQAWKDAALLVQICGETPRTFDAFSGLDEDLKTSGLDATLTDLASSLGERGSRKMAACLEAYSSQIAGGEDSNARSIRDAIAELTHVSSAAANAGTVMAKVMDDLRTSLNEVVHGSLGQKVNV